MKFYITVFCLMLFLVLPLSTSLAQLNWKKDPANPVLTGGAPNAWNENIWGPSILFNPDSGRYEMWFSAHARQNPPYYWRPYHIGYAFSDDGINNWNMHNSPVLDTTTGKWDELTVEAQTVILENGIYKMWYSGWNIAWDSAGIGYATSTNGIDWQKHPSYVFGPGTATWEEVITYGPSIMPVAGGYKMWYSATDSNESEWNIGYAFSDSGITWQRDTVNNPVLEVGSPGSWDDWSVGIPFVHRIDSTYYMWYMGISTANNRRVGLAYSNDGIHWTKYDDPATTSTLYAESDPVLRPSPGQWDGSQVESGHVLLFGDTLHMWYDGWLSPKPPNQAQIGHATMPLDTLLKYTQPTGIKILNENLPNGYVLQQNYPNPFNPTTNIEFSIPKSEYVTLKVYNILGEDVATLVSERLTAGSYKYDWDASSLASGVYLYRIKAGDYADVKKMILLR